MATGDELLAKTRGAAVSFSAAPTDSPAEAVAAVDLMVAFHALDEHMQTGGEPPAEWAPATPGWDVIIAFTLDSDHANRACANVQDRYGWACAVRQRGTQQEVVIPFSIRQNAEIVLRKIRNELGYTATMRPTRNTPGQPKEHARS